MFFEVMLMGKYGWHFEELLTDISNGTLQCLSLRVLEPDNLGQIASLPLTQLFFGYLLLSYGLSKFLIAQCLSFFICKMQINITYFTEWLKELNEMRQKKDQHSAWHIANIQKMLASFIITHHLGKSNNLPTFSFSSYPLPLYQFS